MEKRMWCRFQVELVSDFKVHKVPSECVKSLVQFTANNSFSVIHLTGNFILEGYQVCAPWFALRELMLTNTNNAVDFHVFGNGFRDDLLHHLPRKWGWGCPAFSFLSTSCPPGSKEQHLLSSGPHFLICVLMFKVCPLFCSLQVLLFVSGTYY